MCEKIKNQLNDINDLRLFCEKQLVKANNKINDFLETSQRVNDYFSESDIQPILARYITCLNAVLEHAMRINLALDECAPVHDKILEIKLNKKEASEVEHTNSLAAEVSTKITNLSNACDLEKKNAVADDADGYPPNIIIDLSSYEIGAQISATVTHINADDNFFYIRNNNAQKIADLLRFMLCLQQTEYKEYMPNYSSVEPPPLGEVFGFAFEEDQVMVRAMRTSEVYASSSNNMQFYDVYLLDFGYKVPLSVEATCYHVNKLLKLKPAQAVRCEIVDKEKQHLISNKIMEDFEFRILEIRNRNLIVDIVERQPVVNQSQSTNPFINDPCNENVPETVKQQVPELEKACNAADWQMFNEETLSTTNVMKAVLGHIPKDEQRICRFYNPKTGNCFKGGNCHMEHTILDPDGVTKDVEPLMPLKQIQKTTILYDKNTRLMVTPTHIKSMTHYYANINGQQLGAKTNGIVLNKKDPFIWCYDDLPAAKNLKRLPYNLEIVLAKYNDDKYYRAQIIQQTDNLMYLVHFVDYGNEHEVSVTDMADCDDITKYHPFQAVLLRIAGVCEKTDIDAERRKMGIKLISDTILHKPIIVKVIAQYQEDILAKFINREHNSMLSLLVAKGFVNPYDNHQNAFA